MKFYTTRRDLQGLAHSVDVSEVQLITFVCFELRAIHAAIVF